MISGKVVDHDSHQLRDSGGTVYKAVRVRLLYIYSLTLSLTAYIYLE